MSLAPTPERILIIRHGALGDMILTTGPFAAIRAHHPNAHITLLTTKPFAALLAPTPYFDEIWIDARPKLWQVRNWAGLVRKLRAAHFTRVYDLQTSKRSAFYIHFFCGQKVEWSGISRGASHRHDTKQRTTLHTLDRQKEQLAIAGITEVPAPNIDWLTGDVSNLLPLPGGGKLLYALLVPGGSAHRPQKRWPAEYYAEVAKRLLARKVTPVLIGGPAEADVLHAIEARAPGCLNLCAKTDFGQIAALARGAALALGNDTGPMHIIAAAGAPSTVLFSSDSKPELCAPRGGHVRILRESNLADLSADTVWQAISAQLPA